MLVDWFTVGAQVLNFIVLVWLMKRFLYRPILDAIDAREARVAAALADAESKKAAARMERDEFQRRTEELEQRRAALLADAEKDAQSERRRLLEEARKAADKAMAQRQQALDEEAQRLRERLVHRTQDEVFAIARKVLADLASAGLEERAVAAFEDRLRSAGDEAHAAIEKALDGASAPALVRSAFELSEALRARLQATIEQAFQRHVALRFEAASELLGGIEFSVNGQKLTWTIADHLAAMQENIGKWVADRPAAPQASR